MLLQWHCSNPSTALMQGLQTYLQVSSPLHHPRVKTNDNRIFHIKQLGRQLPMTPAYTFTDYKSQGQIIEYIIMVIGDPPTGHMPPFGVYVALSRIRGRGTIRLLRDFNEKLFTHHPSEGLRLETIRLKRMNQETKRKVNLESRDD